MPTHAELSSKLLVDAASFFRTLGDQNESLKAQMDENATVFEQMAELVVQDPDGEINGSKYAEMTGKLLKDASNFFKTLADENEPIRDQMAENADIYSQIGDLVAQDPNGILE